MKHRLHHLALAAALMLGSLTHAQSTGDVFFQTRPATPGPLEPGWLSKGNTKVIMFDATGHLVPIAIGGNLSLNAGVLDATGATIADGSITNAKIASNAAIALSKLATDPLARANHTGTQSWSTITGTPTTRDGYGLTDVLTTTELSSTYAGLASPTFTGVVNVGARLVSSAATYSTTIESNDAAEIQFRNLVTPGTGKLRAPAFATDDDLLWTLPSQSGTLARMDDLSAAITALNLGTASTLASGDINTGTVANGNVVTYTDYNSRPGTIFAKSAMWMYSDPIGGSSYWQIYDTGGELKFAAGGGSWELSINGSLLTADRVVSTQDKDGALALLTNNLGEFSVTTSAQLLGKITDESGTGVLLTTNGSGASLTALNVSNASSGTLAVSRGGTGITSLGTGVATAMGNATNGTGGLLTFGGALGTPASGTVTNLTGTASININGTVGATTPASGAFTTVSATGATTLGESLGSELAASTAAGYTYTAASPGWSATDGPLVFTRTASASNLTIVQTTQTITAGAVYKVIWTAGGTCAGTVQVSVGGVSASPVTHVTGTTYTEYITAATTSRLTFTIVSTTTGTISGISCKAVASTLGTSSTSIPVVVTSPLYSAQALTIPAGSVSSLSLSPAGDSNTGIFFSGADALNFVTGGISRWSVDSNGTLQGGSSSIQTSGNTIGTYFFARGGYYAMGASDDVIWQRLAANHGAFARSTNPQSMSVANTFTNATNYEALTVDWSSNIARIRPTAAGTGTVRTVRYYLTDTVWIGVGSGSPEGVESAGIGSTFHRTDGGAGTSHYVKESGTGNTGWIAK